MPRWGSWDGLASMSMWRQGRRTVQRGGTSETIWGGGTRIRRTSPLGRSCRCILRGCSLGNDRLSLVSIQMQEVVRYWADHECPYVTSVVCFLCFLAGCVRRRCRCFSPSCRRFLLDGAEGKVVCSADHEKSPMTHTKRLKKRQYKHLKKY